MGRLENERCRAGGGGVGKNCRNDGPNGIKMVENLPGILLAGAKVCVVALEV